MAGIWAPDLLVEPIRTAERGFIDVTREATVLIQTTMAAGIEEASDNIDADISSVFQLANILSLNEHQRTALKAFCWWKLCFRPSPDQVWHDNKDDGQVVYPIICKDL